jgi:hypothetical protein
MTVVYITASKKYKEREKGTLMIYRLELSFTRFSPSFRQPA